MMRGVLAGLMMLAACQAGAGDDYPPRPGGGGPVIIGGGGGGTGGDAGGAAGSGSDAGIPIEGRVCVITDLRELTTCSATGAKGLLVALGSGPKLTVDSDDGHFTFLAPSSNVLVWHVSSATADRIVASAMPYGTDHTIPVISTQTYTTLRALYGAGLPVDQQASVVVRVVRGLSPVAGVGATTTLVQNNSIFYDGNPALKDDWGTTQTGVAGVVWFPGVSLIPSTATVTLVPQGTASVSVPVAVQDGTITFVTKDIP